jgi:phosphoribosylaminoimidazolecarboxamide formyltransferase/IMP cyclohydrolase
MGINLVEKIDEGVKVRHVLISVSDKSGLETFLPQLVSLAPEVKVFSTGGTFRRIEEILGTSAAGRLQAVSRYTGQPETQGGLVKTLDFKIYLGLLTETYNDAHQADLARTGAVPIDMVVVNLYPFADTVARKDATPEMARGNIDIGGPCMIRAAAKNFIRIAPVVDPRDYPLIVSELKADAGATSLALRYRLARKAFDHTARYDRAIADYLDQTALETVHGCYRAVR